MSIQPEVSTVAAASRVLAIAVVPVATLTLPSADATTTSTASATTTTTSTRRSLTTVNMKKKRATNNVLKTLAIVTVAFVVCWMPNKCYSFLYLIGVKSNIGEVYYVTFGLALFNSCVNPLIYIIDFKEFRKVCVLCVGVSDNYGEISVTSANLDVDVRYKTKSVLLGFSPYLLLRTLKW